MRFGLNTFFVSPGFTNHDIPLIQDFKNFGTEVIELAIVDPGAVSVAALNNALNESNLPNPIITGAFGPGRDLRGNPDEIEQSVTYIEALIKIAKEIDANLICGPFYSQTGRCGAHSPAEQEAQMDLVAKSLKTLCKQAEDAGIILAVEPLNRFETDFINTLEQATHLIEQVGSDSLKIHIDTFHMNIEEADSATAIRKASNLIGHVHASASHRGLLGKDQVDWSGVLTALKDINYTGDIVIESFNTNNKTIAKAASIWRKLYDSPEQLAVEGLAFLKKEWKQISETAPIHI